MMSAMMTGTLTRTVLRGGQGSKHGTVGGSSSRLVGVQLAEGVLKLPAQQQQQHAQQQGYLQV
jgi:hypothetical protein